MHSAPLKIIMPSRSILSPNLPYITRETPMSTEKSMGPARSPTVFETPRPFSAKVEAHWLTACSLAPEQSIRSMNIQNILLPSSCLNERPVSPSSISGAIGTRIKFRALTIGTTAQIRARYFQLAVVNIEK